MLPSHFNRFIISLEGTEQLLRRTLGASTILRTLERISEKLGTNVFSTMAERPSIFALRDLVKT